VIVDNLLSADIGNVPDHAAVDFGWVDRRRQGAGDAAARPRLRLHLGCYHGNQSSIHDPLADHRNNTLTSLKLFDCLKDFCR
jgi:hypothetical protein